jgi:hypothetical protein
MIRHAVKLAKFHGSEFWQWRLFRDSSFEGNVSGDRVRRCRGWNGIV